MQGQHAPSPKGILKVSSVKKSSGVRVRFSDAFLPPCFDKENADAATRECNVYQPLLDATVESDAENKNPKRKRRRNGLQREEHQTCATLIDSDRVLDSASQSSSECSLNSASSAIKKLECASESAASLYDAYWKEQGFKASKKRNAKYVGSANDALNEASTCPIKSEEEHTKNKKQKRQHVFKRHLCPSWQGEPSFSFAVDADSEQLLAAARDGLLQCEVLSPQIWEPVAALIISAVQQHRLNPVVVRDQPCGQERRGIISTLRRSELQIECAAKTREACGDNFEEAERALNELIGYGKKRQDLRKSGRTVRLSENEALAASDAFHTFSSHMGDDSHAFVVDDLQNELACASFERQQSLTSLIDPLAPTQDDFFCRALAQGNSLGFAPTQDNSLAPTQSGADIQSQTLSSKTLDAPLDCLVCI